MSDQGDESWIEFRMTLMEGQRDEARGLARRFFRELRTERAKWVRVIRLLQHALDKARGEQEEMRRRIELIEQGTVSDGHGSYWPVICPRCGAPMHVVGVGAARCSGECWREVKKRS